jgi:hypothetical protein
MSAFRYFSTINRIKEKKNPAAKDAQPMQIASEYKILYKPLDATFLTNYEKVYVRKRNKNQVSIVF